MRKISSEERRFDPEQMGRKGRNQILVIALLALCRGAGPGQKKQGEERSRKRSGEASAVVLDGEVDPERQLWAIERFMAKVRLLGLY